MGGDTDRLQNTLKGAGFFLGGLLLTLLGFQGGVLAMVIGLAVVWLFSMLVLIEDLGKAKNKPKFKELFSKSASINYLSAARMCLFGARDVWFVVALPVFLASQLDWDHWTVGSFLAIWVMAYGVVQGFAPVITGAKAEADTDRVPGRAQAVKWAAMLALIPLAIAAACYWDMRGEQALLIGLLVFGFVFAVNSSLHSFLIVQYAGRDGVSLDVGFYYMANAMGRLLGTVLSGWVYQVYGLEACLLISAGLVFAAAVISMRLPKEHLASS